MGDIKFSPGTLYITNPETGDHAVLRQIAEAPALETGTYSGEWGYPVKMKYDGPIKEKVEIELKIQSKKMTRKKFIKWLMSQGLSRNEAHDCAWYFNDMGMPYSSARFYIMEF